MAKKVKESKEQGFLEKLKDKKVIFGLKRAIKLKKDIKEIYVSNDLPDELVAKLNKPKKLDFSKEEIKEVLNKKFNISVISVLK
ncbi:MAG: hypothetical protein ABH817_01010 [archaeon]